MNKTEQQKLWRSEQLALGYCSACFRRVPEQGKVCAHCRALALARREKKGLHVQVQIPHAIAFECVRLTKIRGTSDAVIHAIELGMAQLIAQRASDASQ
jgi:hypothetical protein